VAHSNSNINQRNHISSRQHGDIGMSTELQHVRGTINNDEYAVINRNTLHHQQHPPTNTVINREIVYITPTPEYDRLNHSDRNALQLNNRVYDRNTQNDTGYNTAMFHVRQPRGYMIMFPWTDIFRIILNMLDIYLIDNFILLN
jgi:hypothetical protein